MRDAARIVTKLEVATWGLGVVLVGAGVGLAVVRPWAHRGALSLSGSHTSSELVTPSAGGTCPDVVVRSIEQPLTIPRSAWIHASDGVNVRAAPSASATRLTRLATGTQVSVEEQQGNADGIWYRIHLSDGRDGWLSGRYTTAYPISPASTDALKIWVPAGYQLQSVAPGKAEARYKNEPLALLYVQNGTWDQRPTQTLVPAGLPSQSTWMARPTVQVLVGYLPAT